MHPPYTPVLETPTSEIHLYILTSLSENPEYAPFDNNLCTYICTSAVSSITVLGGYSSCYTYVGVGKVKHTV